MPERADITSVENAARMAAGAHARRRFVTVSGWAAAWSLGLSAIGVLGLRLATGAAWWWAIPVGAFGAALFVGLVMAARTRWDLAHAAGELDRVHETQGALRTAIEIREDDGEPELVGLAKARGIRLASAVDPGRASDPARPAGWWWAILGSAGAISAGLFAQPVTRSAPRIDPGPMIQRALDQIEVASQDAAEIDPAALPEPEAWEEVFEEIRALEEELRGGSADADAPARTAAALEEAADELERQAERAALEEQSLRDLADSFDSDSQRDAPSRAGAGPDDPSALVDRLADALARNDMLDAEQAARAIDEAERTMSDEQRRELADVLEDLADQLEPEPSPESEPRSGSEAPPPGDDPSQDDPSQDGGNDDAQPDGSLPETLRDRAESLRDEQPSAPPEAPSDQPRPEPGRSQDPDQQNGRSPGTQAEPGQEQPRGEQPSAQREETGRRDTESQPGGSEPARQEQSEQPGEQRQPEPGESEPGQSETGRSREQQGEPRGTTPQDQERQGRQSQAPEAQGQERQGQPTGDPTASEQGSRMQQGEQEQDQEQGQGQGQQPGGGRSEQQPGQQPGQRPGQRPGQQPGGQQERQPGEPQPDGRGQDGQQPGSVERAVRRMREQRQAREENQRVADSLRARARDLVNEGADDPAEDPERGGADPAQPPGTGGAAGAGTRDAAPPGALPDTLMDPARFEPVDASGDSASADDTGRVVGDWFDPNREEIPASDRASAASELRRAARKARDAVDNQQVPRRYRDLVRRVFERVERRADGVAPAAQGQDAKPASGSSESGS